MAEETAVDGSGTDAVNAEPTRADAGPQSDDVEALRVALAKANEDAKKHRLRNRELEPLAAKVKELEDRDKTDQQRLDEARQAAERERDEARQEAARMRVALKHQLKPEDAELLVGDEDRMEALAQRLAAAAQDRPPSFDGGPRSPAAETNANDWIRQQISTAGR